MPKLVTSGAFLKCTLGSTPSQLQVPAAGRVMAGNVPVATITDTAAGIISPFGSCAAMSPPQTCFPAPAGSWTPGSPSVRAGVIPVLHQTSQCHCQRGGVISIVAPGQQTTTVARAESVLQSARPGYLG